MRLPWDMAPYEEVEIDFTVSAPSTEGHYLLELDLMQEAILVRLREVLGEAAPQALRFRVKGDRI